MGFVLGTGLGLLPLLVLNGPSQAVGQARPPFDYNPPPRSSMRPVFRIVAFGSSSTLGIGASSQANSYPARLERLLDAAPAGREPVEVVNRGIGGEDTRDMMRRLQGDILSRKPDLVIWQTGSNDALRHVSVETFKANLRGGIAAIRQTGAEVMVMEPQWCPQIERAEPTEAIVEAIHQVAEETKVVVIARHALMRQWIATGVATERDLIGPDHLHSTDRGYELLARAVFDVVIGESDAYRRAVRPDGSRHAF